jgi:hypothetical protein
MDHITSHNWTAFALAGALVGLLAWPGTSEAQTVTGQATAVRATVLGIPTTLADTGTLSDSSDARDATQITVSVQSLLTGEVLHAITIGYPDEVDSEASLGNLALTVAGNGISADLVMARAQAVLDAAGAGMSNIGGLLINGMPVVVTGDPNQTIDILGGRVVINEQNSSPTGTIIVNALHVIVNGVADVVIASATAGISSASTSALPLPLPSLF